MGWVYRKADVHECAKPRLVNGRDNMDQGAVIHHGDMWQCDDAMCGMYWIVLTDVRGEWYWSKASPQQINQALGA